MLNNTSEIWRRFTTCSFLDIERTGLVFIDFEHRMWSMILRFRRHMYAYICSYEKNVPARWFSQWVSRSSCTWAHAVRVYYVLYLFQVYSVSFLGSCGTSTSRCSSDELCWYWKGYEYAWWKGASSIIFLEKLTRCLSWFLRG